jgi:hypothetical protein
MWLFSKKRAFFHLSYAYNILPILFNFFATEYDSIVDDDEISVNNLDEVGRTIFELPFCHGGPELYLHQESVHTFSVRTCRFFVPGFTARIANCYFSSSSYYSSFSSSSPVVFRSWSVRKLTIATSRTFPALIRKTNSLGPSTATATAHSPSFIIMLLSR